MFVANGSANFLQMMIPFKKWALSTIEEAAERRMYINQIP